MDITAPVEGPNLRLRRVEPADASYIHALRMDPAYNQHLSQVTGTVEDQRVWIEAYKKREIDGREYYYVIERKDGQRCGVVRLYDIDETRFTWGSWILDQNKPPKAALESAVLIYQIAFDLLGLQEARFDVRLGNDNTLAFHRRFGAQQTFETETDVHFVYTRTRFEADRDGYATILSEEAKE